MAKKQDRDLLSTLRASGVRERVARVLTESTGSKKRGKQPALVTRTIGNLKTAAAELDDRVRGSQRSEAAKKAARTRKRNAAKRSAAARKGARTRAKARS
jgi:hypothetical protein